MNRLYFDWTEISAKISFGPEHQFQINYQYLLDNSLLPSVYDIGGAAEAIFRLQETYSIDAETFASGKIDGVEVNATMSAIVCFDIGFQAYASKNFVKSSEWLYESYRRAKIEQNEKNVNWMGLLDALSNSLFQVGNVEGALNITMELLEMFPGDEKANIDLKKYQNSLFHEEGDAETFAFSGGLVDPYEYSEHSEQFKRYLKVCRGELEKTPKEQAKLKCYYNFETSPFLKIGGIKTEQVNIRPPVVVFYDVMNESEIEMMINVSKDKLQRSEVNGESFGEGYIVDYRVSQSTFIYSDQFPFLEKIDKRIEAITGLSTISSEGHQVANYGIGGHYEPHLDFFSNGAPLGIDGNRVATLVFYLTDVIKGGATAFPYLNVRVPARKGSVLFWHNLYKDGEGNYLTRHAACPVLIGNKWSNNVWLRERGQEFNRPCDLQPDHETNDGSIS